MAKAIYLAQIRNRMESIQKEYNVKTSIGHFFTDLFNYKKSFTKSDLDMVTTIYKILDKHVQY